MAEHMDEFECDQMAAFFSIFANPTRLRIFCALQDGPKAVSDLAEQAEVTLQNVSQHLRLMRDKGAVATQRAGQNVYYTVVDERIFEAARLIREALSDQWRQRAEGAASARAK